MKLLTYKKLLKAIPLDKLREFLAPKKVELYHTFAFVYDEDGSTFYQLYVQNKYIKTIELTYAQCGDYFSVYELNQVADRTLPFMVALNGTFELYRLKLESLKHVK